MLDVEAVLEGFRESVPSYTREKLEGMFLFQVREATELRNKLQAAKAEVNQVLRELELEREARLSTEKEKKGLSLLDMLTRSGLTKTIDVAADPELSRFLGQALKDAIRQSLGQAGSETREPPGPNSSSDTGGSA
jgi:hypothetical protein